MSHNSNDPQGSRWVGPVRDAEIARHGQGTLKGGHGDPFGSGVWSLIQSLIWTHVHEVVMGNVDCSCA